MWSVYRLTRDAGADQTRRQRELHDDVTAFSNAIVQDIGKPGTWVVSSARTLEGGFDVWYSLPQIPSEPPFMNVWAEALSAYGLCGRRITNRN